MTHERKPTNEKWEDFAERKIREAQAEGAFDRLSGFGQPIPGLEEPLSENWWLKEKLKREQLQVVPPILEARLALEKALEEIPEISSEAIVRSRLQKINEMIRKAHFSPIAGPSDGIAPIDIDAVIAEWREQR